MFTYSTLKYSEVFMLDITYNKSYSKYGEILEENLQFFFEMYRYLS